MLLKIGFGGGCHWCTEAVFQSIKGVEKVDQGWIASDGEHHAFSEAVLVYFDPGLISQHSLIEAHLLTHSCTGDHSMRQKYRSAIYIFNDLQYHEAVNSLKAFQNTYEERIITKVLPFVKFKENKEELLNYYHSRPQAPFCVQYIDPKLDLLKKSWIGRIIESP